MTYSVKEQELELVEFIDTFSNNAFNPAFEDWELTDEEHEIQDADMLRSTIALSEAWDSNAEYSIDEMCEHLDALIAVVERKSDYNDFVNETNITNKSYLQ